MSNRNYTLEFKKQAVELSESLGSATKAAEQLGIPDVNIHVWRKKLNTSGSTKSSTQEDSRDEEIRKLRKENAELKKVNHILKAAAAFFSQDHLK